jgi:hypothetical protein
MERQGEQLRRQAEQINKLNAGNYGVPPPTPTVAPDN